MTKRIGSPDRSRVNVNVEYDVRYWTKKFGCTEEQLRACVMSVGALASDVEKHLLLREVNAS
jgi:hypothetical protein